MLIGIIADDLTGATDVAVNLAREGLSVVQLNGLPDEKTARPDTDAVVIALKSRTIPAINAVDMATQAARWLREQGAERIYFKYCSTFDSTAAGNIGPVTDALLDLLGTDLAVATPAYPRNQRTVYRGHLFVGDRLLSESSMRHHPLTPMADPDLVRCLAAQTKGQVGLIGWEAVKEGEAGIRAQIVRLRTENYRHAILDAIEDEHLIAAGRAVLDMPLTTGGSGLAMGLAVALRNRATGGEIAGLKGNGKPAVILAGSCSQATLAQVKHAAERYPSLALDPITLSRDGSALEEAVDWAKRHLGETPILIYASQPAEQIAITHKTLGRDCAAGVVEYAFRTLARQLAKAGAGTFLVAGGETSGAVIEALEIKGLAIGPEIAPGVPWTVATDGEPIRLALKSGNFGQTDFFSRALDMLHKGDAK
jgi:uncharacterized protein YgbK (DUF1537 family)